MASTHRKQNSCMKCRSAIHPAGTAFKCDICLRHVHVSCADATFTKLEISKLTRAGTPFLFTCPTCVIKFKYGSSCHLLFAEDETKELRKKHQTELNELTSTFNQQQLAIQKQDEHLQQLQQRLEILSREVRFNSTASTSRSKRQRNHSVDHQSDIDAEAPTESPIVQLIKVL